MIHNIKYRAMAELIKYFIDSAINPKFQHNVYHQALYEWYVDGDTKMKNPELVHTDGVVKAPFLKVT